MVKALALVKNLSLFIQGIQHRGFVLSGKAQVNPLLTTCPPPNSPVNKQPMNTAKEPDIGNMVETKIGAIKNGGKHLNDCKK